MSSQYQDLFDHMVLGHKLKIPIGTTTPNKLVGAWHYYKSVNGNVLAEGKVLDITVDETNQYYLVKTKLKQKISFTIVEEVSPNEDTKEK